MAQTQSMSIKEFMQSGYKEEEESFIYKIISHLKRHKIAYRIVGATLFIFLVGADFSTAFAASGIDSQANKLYIKLLNVAKWVIVFKGAIDTVKNVADGDVQAAKKHFLGYLITYVILWALPWGLSEVDKMFSELNASADMR